MVIKVTKEMLVAAAMAHGDDLNHDHLVRMEAALRAALRVAYDVEPERLREMASDLLTEANRREQA